MEAEIVSKVNAQKFVNLMQEDESLKAQVKEIVGKYNTGNFTKEVAEKLINNEIIPIAKARGLDFSFAELQNPNDGELSDSDLEKVLGGITDGNGNWITMCYYSCNMWTPYKPGVDSSICSTCNYWKFESASDSGELSHGISVPMMLCKPGTCMAKH